MQAPTAAPEETPWAALVERHYDLAVQSVDMVSHAMNITLKVTADAGEFYLRLYRETGRTRADIDAEIGALLAFEPADDVYVSKPQRLRKGGYVFSWSGGTGARWGALFAAAPGYETEGRAGELRQLSFALGVLHRQMSAAPSSGRQFDAVATVSVAAESVSMRGKAFRPIGSAMIEAGSALVARLNTGGPLRYGFCHGDVWFGKNVHFDGPRTTFFDFDDCMHGPLAVDLATLIAGLWYAELTDFAAQLRLVLDTYAEVQPLSPRDVMAIPSLVRLDNIRTTGFLAHISALEPNSRPFKRRLAEWGPNGAATAYLRDYAATVPTQEWS